MIFRAESLEIKSYLMTIIIRDFTLVSLSSIATPHPVWPLFGASDAF